MISHQHFRASDDTTKAANEKATKADILIEEKDDGKGKVKE
jgi:hypothetical protein